MLKRITKTEKIDITENEYEQITEWKSEFHSWMVNNVIGATQYDTEDMDEVQLLKQTWYKIEDDNENRLGNGFLSIWEENGKIHFECELESDRISPIHDVMTSREAASEYGLGENVVTTAINRGRLTEGEHRKSGKTWLVTRSAMDRLFGYEKG